MPYTTSEGYYTDEASLKLIKDKHIQNTEYMKSFLEHRKLEKLMNKTRFSSLEPNTIG